MIRRLRLRNFRRYEDETFHFPEGATFIEGENNAGKTSILYAIEYALFGAVAQFKSPSALLRPKSKHCGVELDFEGRDGRQYRLQRVHVRPPRTRTKVIGHYTLLLLTESEDADRPESEAAPTDDQALPSGQYLLSSDFQDHEEKLAIKVHQLLGINKRMFELAISTRQGETARILAGSSKLDIVLGITAVGLAEEEFRSMALQREKQVKSLDVLAESLKRTCEELEKVERRAELLDKERRELEAQQTKLAKQQQQLRNDHVALQAMHDDVEQLRTVVEQRGADRRALESLSKQLAEFLDEYGDAEALQKAAGHAQSERCMLDEQVHKNTKELQRLRKALSEVDQQLGDLAGRVERRSRLNSNAAVCETCGQPIDKRRAQQELEQWKAERLAKSELREQTLVELGNMEESADALRERAQTLREQETAYRRRQEELLSLEQQVERLSGDSQSTGAALQETLRRAVASAVAIQQTDNAMELEPAQVDPPNEENAQSVLATLQQQLAKATTSVEVKTATTQAGMENTASLLDRLQGEAAELETAKSALARESAQLQQELDELHAASTQAETLRRCSKAFQELQERMREQVAESLAASTLVMHRELSHSDEFSKLTIDPANYAVQVKARDYDQFAPASVFQGGGHRVLLGLAYKLAIAQMVGHCPFLLLDEPTDGLDEVHRQQLMKRLAAVQVTRQILVITHQGTAAEIGSRIRIEKNKKSSKRANP